MANAQLLLVVLAIVFTLVNAIGGRLPLWVAVLMLCLALLVPYLPLKVR